MYVSATYNGVYKSLLLYQGKAFPAYSDIMDKLRAEFDLPADAEIVWSDVLIYPRADSDARIMFKKTVSNAIEYENAQKPFGPSVLVKPSLKFTARIADDPSLADIQLYNRAVHTRLSADNLDIHIATICDRYKAKAQVLAAVVQKRDHYAAKGDSLGAAFWGDRISQIQDDVSQLQKRLQESQAEREQLEDFLNVAVNGTTLRHFVEVQDEEEARRKQQTLDEISAWRLSIEEEEPDHHAFPELEDVLYPRARHQRFGPRGAYGPTGRHHGSPHRAHPHMYGPPPGPPPPHHHGHHGHHGRHSHHESHDHHDPRQSDNLYPFGPFGPRGRRHHVPGAFGPGPRDCHFAPMHEAVNDMVERIHSTVNNAHQRLPQHLNSFMSHLATQFSDPSDTHTFEREEKEALNEKADDAQAEPRIPGAFVHTASQTQPEVKPSTALGKGGFRHRHISCDGCNTGIRGMRYQCEKCDDYDLCGTCLPLLDTGDLHPLDHSFKAIIHPHLEERINLDSKPVTPPFRARHSATCDLCESTIKGVRWKCLDCPDWDSCESCASTLNETHAGHSFAKIHKASDYVTSPAIQDSYEVRHTAIYCDGCNRSIRGVRYKCLHEDCSDFDLCGHCEASPLRDHPIDHPMLKIKVPLDVTDHDTVWRVLDKTKAYSWTIPKRRQLERLTSSLKDAEKKIAELEEEVRAAKHSARQEIERELEKAKPKASLMPGHHCDIAAGGANEKAASDMESVKNKEAEQSAEDLKTNIKDYFDLKEAESNDTFQTAVSPSDIFSWARHVTIPSGCVLPPGAEFTKTWRLKHFANGHELYFDEVKLVLKSEGKFGPASHANIVFKAADIKEDEEIEVSIRGLRVPDTPGMEVSDEWRFEDSAGTQYGLPLRLRIVVEGGKSGASSLTSSAVIFPGGTPSLSIHTPHTPVATRTESPVVSQAISPSPAALSSALSSVSTEEVDREEEELYDDLESVHSAASSFIDVDGMTTPSGTTTSVAVTDDRDEFDFVDTESEAEETADEL